MGSLRISIYAMAYKLSIYANAGGRAIYAYPSKTIIYANAYEEIDRMNRPETRPETGREK
jgi:hypothetical protein